MKKLSVLFTVLLTGLIAFAQQPTKEELQRRNTELAKEIAGIRADLDKAKGDKKVTLGLLEQLNRTITKRNQVINNIKGEVYYIEKDIIRTRREMDTLSKELDTLKVQYAKSIIYAYKNRSNYDFLNFLFSAGNFNDALKRLAYLKTYRQYREQQAGRIKKAKEVLKVKQESLTAKRADKNNALSEQNKQINELAQDKKKKDQALAVIKSQEQQLSATISKKDKQRKQNSASINQIIRREIELAKAEDRRREKVRLEAIAKQKAADAAANKNNTASIDNTKPTNNEKIVGTSTPTKSKRAPSVLEQTPEGLISSQEFERNRGNLPWPVSEGVITIPFGNYTIPDTKIKVISEGITIETKRGSTIKSIFEGDVSAVMSLGNSYTVIIRHGKYFTTYAMLETVSVSKGQKVNTGQAIGTAGIDDQGIGEVVLQVYKESGPINPAVWIRR
jgi:murein hydrolase activator